jgi:hypothetical protein
VGRDVRAFGHVAQVAEITVIHDLPVVLFGDAVHLHGIGFVDQIEQGGKGLAEADAATAAMADVVDPFQFLEQGFFVVKLRVLPIQGMASRRFEVAFARGGGRCGHGFRFLIGDEYILLKTI